jgi:hypothetical protein
MLLSLGRSTGSGMFAMVSGVKAPRRPEQLAEGTLSLETRPPAAPTTPNQGGAAPAGANNPLASNLYRLRLSFPNGQKDEYVITLSRPAPQAQVPVSPTPPVPTEK